MHNLMNYGSEIAGLIPKSACKILDVGCANGDVEKIDPCVKFHYFDCIIFADVLERINYPVEVLRKYNNYLKDDGLFIISVPNARNIKALFNLITLAEWRYEAPGIIYNGHKHLRFFTLKSSRRVIKKAGLEPMLKNRIFSFKGSRVINLLTFGIFKDFLTAQYIFLAKRKHG